MTKFERLEAACECLTQLTGDKWNLEEAPGSKYSVHVGGRGYLSRKSKVGAWQPTAMRWTWSQLADRLYNELDLCAEFIEGMPEADSAREVMKLLED